MKRSIITFYLIISLLFAAWSDQMDRTYGVKCSAMSNSFIGNVLVGLMWPVMLPLSMGVIAFKTGRWMNDDCH